MRARVTALAAGLAVMAGLAAAGLVASAASGAAARASAARAAASRFSSCPRSDRTVPATQAPGAAAELVPPGADGLLLCRYRGLNPSSKRFRLIASDKIRKSSTVLHISGQLNALPPMTGIMGCPADFGALIVAFFHYRGASDQVVKVDTSGCETVDNGALHRTAATAPGLVHELEAMTR